MLVRNGCSVHHFSGLDKNDVLRDLDPRAAIEITSLMALAYWKAGKYSGCFVERDLKEKGDNGPPQSQNRSVAAAVIEPVSNSCALPLRPSYFLWHFERRQRPLCVAQERLPQFFYWEPLKNSYASVCRGGLLPLNPSNVVYVLMVVFIETSLISSLKSKRFRKDCLLDLHFYSATQSDWDRRSLL